MFDGSLAEIADLAGLDDAALVDTVRGWAQVEAAASARKLAAMAELFDRRTDTPTAEDRELWWVDPCSAVGAELGAAQGISRWQALAQARNGVALRDRLPAVATLLAQGQISEALVSAIVWSTQLVHDPDALARIDAALAERVSRWGAWSAKKIGRAVDALVLEHDPASLRRGKAAARSRYVDFGSPHDEPGTISVYGRLHAHDGNQLEARVNALADSVCPDDPRSRDQLRADALGALGADVSMACQCGRPDCSAQPGTPRNALLYIVAEPVTVAAARQEATRAATPDSAEPDPEPGAEPGSVPPAFVIGGGVLPAYALAEILPSAQLRTVVHPGDSAPEPHYTPSRALAEFVRCRDLTCRWPGCDVPADRCDLDHTVPYPQGPTHASNLKALCRFHHLMKTFWVGADGWADRQLPDGTVIFTAPSGHEYTTVPGSRLLIPTLAIPTGTLDLPEHGPDAPGAQDRGAMMPKRRHTRAHNTARRIAAERKLNDDLIADSNAPPPF